ncbi:hypothetical protein D3C72_2271820 [compost metagenome]
MRRNGTGVLEASEDFVSGTSGRTNATLAVFFDGDQSLAFIFDMNTSGQRGEASLEDASCLQVNHERYFL